jgi:hypothetical protein
MCTYWYFPSIPDHKLLSVTSRAGVALVTVALGWASYQIGRLVFRWKGLPLPLWLKVLIAELVLFALWGGPVALSAMDTASALLVVLRLRNGFSPR